MADTDDDDLRAVAAAYGLSEAAARAAIKLLARDRSMTVEDLVAQLQKEGYSLSRWKIEQLHYEVHITFKLAEEAGLTSA